MAKTNKLKVFLTKHKRLCIVLLILIFLAVFVAGFVVRAKKAGEEMLEAMNQPQIAEIERRTLVSSVSATGKVTSAGTEEVTVDLSGVKIIAIPVNVGDIVEEGSILCEFDSEDIAENLREAEKALAVTTEKTQLDLNAAQRSLEEAQNTRNIELKRKDQDVAAAWNEYIKAVNDMETAKAKWQEAMETTGATNGEYQYWQEQLAAKRSSQSLSGNQGVSGNQGADANSLESQKVSYWQAKLEAAKQAENSAKAAYEQAEAALQTKKTAYENQVRAKEDAIRSNDSAVANRTDSLTTSQLTASTSSLSDEKKVEDYQRQLDDCILKSPVNGIITAISQEAGDTYSGGTLFTIEDISAYEVSAQIDEYDIGKIKEGQRVIIKTNGTQDEELEGEVLSIAPRATADADVGTGSSGVTYNVRISIDSPSELLKLDMTAKLSIIVSSRENVLTVPYEAVQEDENGNDYVEVVENRGTEGENSMAAVSEGEQAAPITTRRVIVEKGIESDYYVEIISEEVVEGTEVVVPASEEDGLDIQSLIEQQGPMGGF